MIWFRFSKTFLSVQFQFSFNTVQKFHFPLDLGSPLSNLRSSNFASGLNLQVSVLVQNEYKLNDDFGSIFWPVLQHVSMVFAFVAFYFLYALYLRTNLWYEYTCSWQENKPRLTEV